MNKNRKTRKNDRQCHRRNSNTVVVMCVCVYECVYESPTKQQQKEKIIIEKFKRNLFFRLSYYFG